MPAALLSAALLVAACSASVEIGDVSPAASPATSPATSSAAGNTYLGNGVTFTYPADWQELSLTDPTASSGNVDWQVGVGPGPGDNLATVSQFTLAQPITADNIAEAEPSTTQTMKDLFTQAGGSLTSGPEQGTMGGLPTLVYTGTLTVQSGEAQSTVVLAFDGATQYYLNCQATADMVEPILKGCEQISTSFQKTAA